MQSDKAGNDVTMRNYSLAHVFWNASTMLAESKKNSRKSLFLMTSNDDPHVSDSSLRNSARTRAGVIH